MPDVFCKHCGEPWDAWGIVNDMWDDETGDTVPAKEAQRRFAENGCGAFDGNTKCSHAMVDEDRAASAAVKQEFSEHIDEWL